MTKKKVRVRLPNGMIIRRVANLEKVENYVMIWIRYKGKKYIINKGDEYLRGFPQIFDLGKEVEKVDLEEFIENIKS
jgi:hypothetical protein